MTKQFLILLTISTFTVVFGAGPYVWPLPKSYTISNDANIAIASNFSMTAAGDGANSDILKFAIDRYTRLIFPHTPEKESSNGMTSLSGLTVSVSNGSENTLQYGMDESYKLYIPSSGDNQEGLLTANTIWGALRGLETFSQIVIYNFTAQYYQVYSASIEDEPRFSHRGILIDTSRHFQTVESIKTVLLSMSFAKFNTLHWHIIDIQSFPYESKLYPLLWNGAYSAYERYSQNDILDIITFAKYLGIRIIPEWDMPGHATSWCVGYPDVCPSKTCQSPLNPASNLTWDIVTGLIKESTMLFFDNFIHLGGDEVNTDCWSSTASIEEWMKEHNYTARQALRYFDERAESIAYNEYNKNVINWVEVFNLFNTTLDPSIVTIQVWKAKQALANVVEKGFNAILADSDFWYLDHLTITWEQMYLNEPFQSINDPTQQALVLGGETCMWGETVDVSDIEQTIWPRAAAVAERLWSPRHVNNTQDAEPRIAYFRCLLNQRDIAAAPFNNSEAREAPSGPGSCYDQRR